jgi:hypothetical protein
MKRKSGAGRGPSPQQAKRGRPSNSKATAVAVVSSSVPHPITKHTSAATDDDFASSSPATTTYAAVLDPQEELLSTSSSLFEYLERLPLQTLRSIYALPAPRGPIVSASVLRSSCLTELARQFALRLVACGGIFPVSSILEGWVHRSSSCQMDSLLALKRLEIMGILEPHLGLACRRRFGGENNIDEGDEEDVVDQGSNSHGRLTKFMGKDAQLTPEFRDSMKLYLSTSSSSPWPIITREQIIAASTRVESDHNTEKEKPSRDPPTCRELEAYTQSSWDSVLHFLVGSDDTIADRNQEGEDGGKNSTADGEKRTTIAEPSVAMVQFLMRIGLMQEDPDYTGSDISRAPLVITSKGYEFMLRDTNAQVWQFVLQYLNSLTQHHHHHEKKDAILIDALSYLICLGSTRVGDGYHISTVVKSKAARQVMKDFGRFGLVFFCRVADKTAFYPTSLAVNLIASNEKARQQDAVTEDATTSLIGPPSVAATRSLEESLSASIPSRSHLAVIVQTNFQVVAYTRSKLHISTLGLFCDISSYRQLPNVIIFFITRDSIKSALRLGVTASQILRFLQVHAHPMLRNNNDGDVPLVPANVRDQILLWDRERRRVVMDEVRAARSVFFFCYF